MIKKSTLLLLFSIIGFLVNAQISITNLATPYSQDFNTLANTGTTNTTLPTGWALYETGTSANTSYAADNGSLNSGNTYSYGTTSSTERAFGCLQSGSVAPTLGVQFTNNSGTPLTSITITYTGEQWRIGALGREDRLDFQYSSTATSLSTGTWTDENNLDFISPNTTSTVGALDGNLAANRTTITYTISGLNIASGASLWLRWVDYNPAGSDDGQAVDDFTATFNGVTVPACTEPTVQPSGLVLTPTPTTISGVFTPVPLDADGYLIVRSTSATLSATPIDGTSYSIGQAFGGGVVVSTGSTPSFTSTGLLPSTLYYYFIFAYNDESCSGAPNYLITAPLQNSTTTLPIPACVTPSAAPTNLVLTPASTSVSGSFSAAAGANNYLVVRSTNATLGFTPANGTTYTAGQVIGADVVVAYGSSTTFSAAGLTASTQYYFFVFAAAGDCSGQPFYKTPALINNTTTITAGATGIPTGYYNAAAGLTCQPLKTALRNIVATGQTQLSYTPGVWTAYQYTDIHRNDANTADIIWDMYSDNPTGPEAYTFTFATNQCGSYSGEGGCYNREHSTPKSWFADAYPMYTDLNHLFPTDGYVNNIRNNYPYGEVVNATFTSTNGSKLGTGTNFGYNGIVFEPRNEYKGDFARACLYMATRYENEIIANNWSANGNANELFLSATDQPDAALRKLNIYDPWMLSTLLKWHNQDPVSQKEIDRNNAIYYQSGQGNRNPFIDHPEYVALIFQCGSLPACVAPTAQPTALVLTPSVNSVAGSFTASVPAASNYLVVRSTSSTLSASPVNATTYTSGTTLGGGVVVSYGTTTTFSDASLASNTQYYYFIFAANNTSCTGGPMYLTTSPLINNTTTSLPACVAPTAQPTTLILTPIVNSVAGSFTASVPAASNYLVVRSTSSTLSASPVNATTYTAGTTLGGGVVVSYGTTTTFNDASLASNTQYYYFIFAANNTSCTGGPMYLATSPLINNTTTSLPACVAPTTQPTALVLTPTVNSVAGSFTASVPAASNYLVVRSTSNTLSASPVNTTTYTAGNALGGGIVVSFGGTTSFNDAGLLSNTLYYYFIFAANNTSCTGGPMYLTISPLNNNTTTSLPACVAPTTQPTALVLTPTVNSVAGSFTASVPAASNYLVVRSTSSTLSASPVNATTYTAGTALGGGVVVSFGGTTSFNDAGLLSNTLYYYFIFAANNTSCTGGPMYLTISPLTNNTTTSLPACVAPTAQPTTLILTPTVNSITGSFTASVPSATNYLVVRSTSSTLSSSPVNATSYTVGATLGGGIVVSYGSTTNFIDAGLTVNVTYYYFVFAANNTSCTVGPMYLTTSPLTNNATTSLPACVAPTTQPTALVLTPTVNSVAGSFTASVPAASNYLVVRSTLSTLSASPINATTYTAGTALGGGVVVSYGSTTTFNDAGLLANTTYYYFVFSANNTSCIGGPKYLTTSPLTNNVSTSMPVCVAPSAQPTSLVLTPLVNSLTGSFTASTPAASNYLVVRSTSSTLSASPINSTIYSVGTTLGGGVVVSYGSTTTFTDAGLAANTTYYYFVFSANNASCTGGPIYLINNPLINSSTTQNSFCTYPVTIATNLILSSTYNTINGSFTPATNANNYLVVVSNNSSLSSLPVNGVSYTSGTSFGGGTIVSYGTSTSFVINGNLLNDTYYIYVFAANGGCTGQPVYNQSALTGSIGGSAGLYPNPVKNSFTIRLSSPLSSTTDLRIYNEAGALVKMQTINAGVRLVTQNVYFLPSGNYHIVLQNSTQTIYRRFSIVR